MLSRYLAIRSADSMPPIARAEDDLLHVAKLAVATAIGGSVYIVDDDNRYLGAVSKGGLTRKVFEHLDPNLFVEDQARATTGLLRLGRNVSGLSARSLIESCHAPLHSRETVTEAMCELYKSKRDEAPVVNDAGQMLGIFRSRDVLREWVEDTLLTQMGDETESFY